MGSLKVFFRLIFLSLILLSLYFSLIPASQSVPVFWNDKLVHCVSYFFLTLALDFSWGTGEKLLIKGCLIFLYSSMIEFGQSFVPGRDMSIEDIAANTIGILMFIILVPMFKKINAYQLLLLK